MPQPDVPQKGSGLAEQLAFFEYLCAHRPQTDECAPLQSRNNSIQNEYITVEIRRNEQARALYTLFALDSEIEYFPGRDLTTPVVSLREKYALCPVIHLYGAVVLSKLYRVRFFDLASSLEVANGALDDLEKMERSGVFVGSVKGSLFVPAIKRQLLDQRIWTCIFLRRYEQAASDIAANKKLLANAQNSLLDMMAETFVVFMRALDTECSLHSAARMFEQCAQYTKSNPVIPDTFYEHLRLYQAFCHLHDNRPVEAKALLVGLLDAAYPLARIYSNLLLAHAHDLANESENCKRHLDCFCSQIEGSAHSGKYPFRNYTVPYFYFLECRLRLKYLCVNSSDSRARLIAGLRSRSQIPLANLERIPSVHYRLCFGPQVYRYNAEIVAALLTDPRQLEQDHEQRLWLVAYMEKARNAGLTPWYTAEQVVAAKRSRRAMYSSAMRRTFNVAGDKPVRTLCQWTQMARRSACIFSGTFANAPSLVWFCKGKSGFLIGEQSRSEHSLLLSAPLLELFAKENTEQVYLFSGSDVHGAQSDLSRRLSAGLNRAITVYYAIGAVSAAAKTRTPFAPARQVVLYDQYQDRLGEWATKCFEQIQQATTAPTGFYRLSDFRSKEALFEVVDSATCVYLYAHGRAGATALETVIEYADGRTLGCGDLMGHGKALKNKALLLCACETGLSAPHGNEMISMGSVAVAMGARFAYCPLTPFNPREFPDRTREFIESVYNKPCTQPPSWRLIF